MCLDGLVMDVRRIVVVVEDVEAARTALKWALNHLIRFGDFITLLHVYPVSRSKSKSKTRLLRLKGFKLALTFKDICASFPNTKVEMVVTEGDEEGKKIAAIVREIGASELVLGLHDHSFLYKDDWGCLRLGTWDKNSMHNGNQSEIRLAMAGGNNIANNFINCRVLAIKQPPSSPSRINKTSSTPNALTAATTVLDSSSSLDFSQIDVTGLQVPDEPQPKIPYKICPNPYAIIWKSRKFRRR